LPPKFHPRARIGNRLCALNDVGSRLTTNPEGRMHSRHGIAVVALGLVLAGGCSRAAQVESDRETIYQAESELVIRVVNRSQLDATIYLVHDGTRDRLGTVTAATAATFRVRPRVLTSGEFMLMADPVGALRTSTSESLHSRQGTEFTWTLESDFSRGSVLVRE
jgi:hypothetical protein